MRTSDRLPEECREEIRAKLEEAKDRLSKRYHPVTIGYISGLAWVLGEGEGDKG